VRTLAPPTHAIAWNCLEFNSIFTRGGMETLAIYTANGKWPIESPQPAYFSGFAAQMLNQDRIENRSSLVVRVSGHQI